MSNCNAAAAPGQHWEDFQFPAAAMEGSPIPLSPMPAVFEAACSNLPTVGCKRPLPLRF